MLSTVHVLINNGRKLRIELCQQDQVCQTPQVDYRESEVAFDSSLVGMTMVLEIRRGRESDISGIAKVVVDTWRATFAGLLPSEYLDGLS